MIKQELVRGMHACITKAHLTREAVLSFIHSMQSFNTWPCLVAQFLFLNVSVKHTTVPQKLSKRNTTNRQILYTHLIPQARLNFYTQHAKLHYFDKLNLKFQS